MSRPLAPAFPCVPALLSRAHAFQERGFFFCADGHASMFRPHKAVCSARQTSLPPHPSKHIPRLFIVFSIAFISQQLPLTLTSFFLFPLHSPMRSKHPLSGSLLTPSAPATCSCPDHQPAVRLIVGHTRRPPWMDPPKTLPTIN